MKIAAKVLGEPCHSSLVVFGGIVNCFCTTIQPGPVSLIVFVRVQTSVPTAPVSREGPTFGAGTSSGSRTTSAVYLLLHSRSRRDYPYKRSAADGVQAFGLSTL